MTDQSQPTDQGGGLWKRTAPDPDGAGAQVPIVEEFVYDALGQTRATRTGTTTIPGSWTCITYGTHGRVTTKAIPPLGAQTATRTLTSNYAVGGDPRIVSVADGAVAGSTNGSTIKTTVDLLGRTIGYEDVWSQSTTTSYDPQTGRVVSINGPLGLQQPVFDTDGRLDQSKLAGSMLADPSYVPGAHGGDLSSVAFPSGVGNASNATGSGTRRVVGLGMVTYYASAATFHIAAGDSAVKTAPAVSCGLLAASIV